MSGIKKLSRVIVVILQIAFFVLPIMAAIIWWQPDAKIHLSAANAGYHDAAITFIPKSYNILHPITAENRAYGFLITLLPIGSVLAVLFLAIRLFKLYIAEKIFTLQNVSCFKYTAIILLVWELILSPIHDTLLSYTLLSGNPPGLGYASIDYSGMDLILIFTAMILWCISWVMAEGVKLANEQARFI